MLVCHQPFLLCTTQFVCLAESTLLSAPSRFLFLLFTQGEFGRHILFTNICLNVFWLSFFSANVIHLLCSLIPCCSFNTYVHKCFFFSCYLIICLPLYLSIYEFWLMFIFQHGFVTFCLSLFNVMVATYKTIITFVNTRYLSVTFNYHCRLVTVIGKLSFLISELKWQKFQLIHQK